MNDPRLYENEFQLFILFKDSAVLVGLSTMFILIDQMSMRSSCLTIKFGVKVAIFIYFELYLCTSKIWTIPHQKVSNFQKLERRG